MRLLPPPAAAASSVEIFANRRIQRRDVDLGRVVVPIAATARLCNGSSRPGLLATSAATAMRRSLSN